VSSGGRAVANQKETNFGRRMCIGRSEAIGKYYIGCGKVMEISSAILNIDAGA